MGSPTGAAGLRLKRLPNPPPTSPPKPRLNEPRRPRGFFGIGAEGVSKPMNLGALMRTANAFGASFVFTIDAFHKVKDVFKSDTSRTTDHVPYYEFDALEDLLLPKGCRLVGVELSEEAIDLPSFRHPLNAAYLLGPEQGSLSQAAQDRCEHVVKIPTRFCVNVSLAGALVMYDRIMSMGGYPERPIMPGGPNLSDFQPENYIQRRRRSKKPQGPE